MFCLWRYGADKGSSLWDPPLALFHYPEFLDLVLASIFTATAFFELIFSCNFLSISIMRSCMVFIIVRSWPIWSLFSVLWLLFYCIYFGCFFVVRTFLCYHKSIMVAKNVRVWRGNSPWPSAFWRRPKRTTALWPEFFSLVFLESFEEFGSGRGLPHPSFSILRCSAFSTITLFLFLKFLLWQGVSRFATGFSLSHFRVFLS